MLKWGLIVVVVLVLLGAGVWGIGASVPERHAARVERVIAMPIATAGARIRDVADYPAWRPGVTVEIKERNGSRTRYVESKDGEQLEFNLDETVPGETFVSTIVDNPAIPFGGAWTFTLEPAGAGATRVIIREEGFVRDPLYRFFARYVFGYEGTMRDYLDALETSA